MNGAFGRKQYGHNVEEAQVASATGPSGKALIDRNEILRSFESARPRFNPLNTDRPHSPELVDLKDPIQVHLLIETALSDSRDFQILSQEEVDRLKKQVQSLTARIDQARTNLVMQSKYRDAAISMSKLYMPGKPEGKRRSLLGNRASGGDSAREAEVEMLASERRCEELATELFSLEKRLMEPQRRLLQHTAGVLQLTHRVPATKAAALLSSQPQSVPNGIPGSPESLYTYSNGRNSLELPQDDGFLDERALYLPLEPAGRMSGRLLPLEIPMKSPIREQNSQLREEADRLREENAQLKAAEQQLRTDISLLQERIADQLEVNSNMEQGLAALSHRLRDVVVYFDPARNADYETPPSTAPVGHGGLLAATLAYLERGLTVAAEEQAARTSVGLRETESAAATAAAGAASLSRTEELLDELSLQAQDALRPLHPDVAAPPPRSDMDGQADYLRTSLRMIETELARAAELSSSVSLAKQNNEQVEAMLMGLWDIIQTGYAEIQQQRAEQRLARVEKGLDYDGDDDDDDDDEMPSKDEDEAMNTGVPYSLQAFSAKVQWLFAQATRLKEQKTILKRQVKQQREMNIKSGAEKERELKQRLDELDNMSRMLDEVRKEAHNAQEELAQARRDLEALRSTSIADEPVAVRAVEDQLVERNAQVAFLEAASANAEARLAAVELSLAGVEMQLGRASEAKVAAETLAESLHKELQEKDEELERLNVMVIELKTEVAIAKAELDGAYGSRAQRAAEAAALSKGSDTTELTTQVEKLKTELANTLKEFEDMTKETIAAEKEKLELEGKLDDAMNATAGLEAEVQSLRDRLEREVGRLTEQLDAERLKVPPSPGVGGAQRVGASMLSEQFRATMKEERKKFQEGLREEQAKRRKLEDELRAAKKALGSGRSPLGPLGPR